MEALIVLYALGWLWQNAMVETKHAGRGTISPRWRRKLARAGLDGGVPRYGSREFMADLWGDFLQKKTEARRAATPHDGEKLSVRDRLRRAREALRDDPKARQGDVPDPTERPIEPRGQRDVTDAPCDRCGTKCRVIDYTPNGGPVLCTTCMEVGPVLRRPIPNPDEHDARVIPMFRPRPEQKTESKESEKMTTVDSGAEAGTFLVTAIEHCEAVAAAHTEHTEGGGGEDFIASLTNEGVHGEPLQAVTDAQEASEHAAEMWRRASRVLAGGDAVKEAYQQAPGTGSREHVTGGE